MNRLNAIDNALNNTTCPRMIDSLIYERKSEEISWKAKAEELRQEELKLMEKKESLIDKLKKLLSL